ncbi:MAG: hypothetical protein IH586_00905, partial [Anaerolineaceae bacterium]|nr:hypothetical protein [Anaerolineaceae bacterium]
ITALVGDLPDAAFQEQLISAALASVNGGTAVTYLLGTASSRAVQAFRGIDYDLVLAPVGGGVLMIALPTGRSALRLAIAFEEALSVQDELAILQNRPEGGVFSDNDEAIPRLEMLGVTKSLGDEEIDADLEETLLNMDPDLEKLDALVAGKMNGETSIEDPDTFWEAAAGREGKELNPPGFLTYEQAQKLGLLKPDEEE